MEITEITLNSTLTFLCTSSMTDNMAFSFSFFKKLCISVSAMGSKGSKVLRAFNDSNFCDIFGKSIPFEPSKMCLELAKN